MLNCYYLVIVFIVSVFLPCLEPSGRQGSGVIFPPALRHHSGQPESTQPWPHILPVRQSRSSVEQGRALLIDAFVWEEESLTHQKSFSPPLSLSLSDVTWFTNCLETRSRRVVMDCLRHSSVQRRV